MHTYSTWAYAECVGSIVKGYLTADCTHADSIYYVEVSGLSSIEADCHPADPLIGASYSLLG